MPGSISRSSMTRRTPSMRSVASERGVPKTVKRSGTPLASVAHLLDIDAVDGERACRDRAASRVPEREGRCTRPTRQRRRDHKTMKRHLVSTKSTAARRRSHPESACSTPESACSTRLSASRTRG
jgi:hypothetical protein